MMTVTICFVIPLIEMETELLLLFVLFYISLFKVKQQQQ